MRIANLRGAARLIELAAAIAAIPSSVALYLWTILGDWYQVQSCPSDALCTTEQQSAIEHDPFTVGLAAIPMVMAIVVGGASILRMRQATDTRPVLYGLTATFVAFCFLTLFTIGALFAPLLPVLGVVCVAAAFAGTYNLEPRT